MGGLDPGRVLASFRRWGTFAVLGVSLVLLGACSADDKASLGRLGVPETSATEQSPYMWELWKWSWVAAMVTGVIVWGLMFYVMIRFRRRSDDEVPVQTRYNLPLEIFYTIAPVIMVVVFFFHTVTVQNKVLEEVENPDHVITVVGQQWSWTFNHPGDGVTAAPYVYTSGTAAEIPTLVLPLGEVVEFELFTPDVIHSFWIPAFMMKMDVVPGLDNSFQVTPTREGTFAGKCAELCGYLHSRMLFNVEVVSPEEYDAYLLELEAKGFTADEPLKGQSYVETPVGLEESAEGDAE